MGRRMSIETRRELVRVVGDRYRSSTALERTRILDEFVAATGYHRKHAIRVLAATVKPSPPREQPRLHLYDAAVREALIVLWEASDRVCGKRLKPLIPILLEALERHGHLHPAGDIRARLLAVSAATIDRLLAPTRLAVRGRLRRPTTPSVRRAVPVRTFDDWNDPPQGFPEADLVSHCGGSVTGLLPGAIHPVHAFATLPKERPGWVEQKNGAVVRRLVGYGPLEGLKAARR